jgi:hypothetical protein
MLVTCFHAGFLLGLFFDREDRCDMFLRNIRTTRRYIPEDSTLHNHRCENLRSFLTFVFLGYLPVVLKLLFCVVWMFRISRFYDGPGFVSCRSVMTRERSVQYGCSSKILAIFLLAVLFIMCHVDPLLGNDREISKYTRAV